MIRGCAMAAVEITRRDLSASELRSAATKTASAKQARRILAIAMVLDGHDRTLAAQAGGMDRQTLRDWAHRYNADGVDGLVDRPRPGLSRGRAGGGGLGWTRLSRSRWRNGSTKVLILRETGWFAGAAPTWSSGSRSYSTSIYKKGP